METETEVQPTTPQDAPQSPTSPVTEEREPSWLAEVKTMFQSLPQQIADALAVKPEEPEAPEVPEEPEVEPDPVLEIVEPPPAPTRQELRRRKLW